MLRPQTTPLTVVLTSPVDQAVQNPYLPLIITFNRPPKQNEVTASIIPDTKTQETIQENILTITPETTFLPETEYTVSLNTAPRYSFRFTTGASVENSPGWNEASQQSYEQYIKENGTQDDALRTIRKQVPIKGNGYTIDYSYTNSTYSITLSPPHDQSKQSFLSWFAQRGITDLTTIRIQYINQ
jgi:hypothetical protein